MRLAALAALVLSVPLQAFAAPLTGSTFEGDDGNITIDNPSNTDWESPGLPNFTYNIDLVKSSSDNAFGQGAKEDIPNPTVVSGSIPPNKSDLSRFYASYEKVASGDIFVYLAWERSNVLGNANMDFEFNQSQTLSSNGVTPQRTAGDILITYDFAQGGTSPSLNLLFWVTGGSTSQCFSSNSLPCWGNRVPLTGPAAEAGIYNPTPSTATFVDDVLQKQGVTGQGQPTIAQFEFGEAAINLSAAGVFPAGQCFNLGNVFLKSRSSTSFTAELKDFIAPTPISISNCGGITIKKITQPSSPTQFTYNTSGLNPSTFQLADQGTQTFTGVPIGSYTVVETIDPSYELHDLTCTALGAGTSASTNLATGTASITMGGGGTVTCTYTNDLKDHIRVQKVTVPSPDPTNTSFGFTTTGAGYNPFSLLNGGMNDSGALVSGTYSVNETVPTGWDNTGVVCADDLGKPVDHTNIQLVAGGPGGSVLCTFTNTARGKISILKVDDSATPLLLAGVQFQALLSSNVVGTCTTSAAGTCDIANLAPGTYTVHEVPTSLPAGYAPAADQTGIALGPGATVSLTFTDPRQFKVIVLVCRKSDNTLYQSGVTFDNSTTVLQSLPHGTALPSGVTEAELCALGGAIHDNVPYGGHSANVNIPQ